MSPPEAPGAGSQPPPAQAPAEETQSIEAAPAPAPSPPPPQVVSEDALSVNEDLERAERELAAADAELSGAAAKRSETQAAEPGRPSDGEGAPAKPKSPSPAAQNTCTTTCKAFASLLRARDSICRIDGSDGARCARANQIVERHTERSTGCGCRG